MARQLEIDINKALENRLIRDGLEESIRIAKDKQLPGGVISQLEERFRSAQSTFKDSNDYLLRAIPDSVCFIQAPNNWCAIRFSTKKNRSDILYRPVLPKDLIALEVDPARKRDYSESELESILLSVEDTVSLDLYNQKVIEKAECILERDFGVEAPKVNPLVPRVSSHACLRWTQRKLKIDRAKAEEHRRMHYDEIVGEVISGFNLAKLVWTDDEDIDYYLDGGNMVYIVGNNVIITLYELDFGFTPSINSVIATQQLQVLHEARISLEERVEDHNKYAQESDRSISEVEYEIRTLKSRMEELVAQKTMYHASKDLSIKSLNREYSKFNAEFNKLFRTIKDK